MKKVYAFILLFLVSCMSVFAIGFGYHIIEARADVDFASGIYPVSLSYQFNFPVKDIVDGSSTVFAFALDNGLEFRTLRQNPDDGSFYAMNPPEHTLDYMTVFDEFNLFFRQGFMDDELSFELSIDGRFENSYESMSFMKDGNSQGLFWDGDKPRFADSSFIGAPELGGDRSVFQSYVSAVFTYDLMKDEIVRRDGMRFRSRFRITGPWMPLNDKTASFYISDNTLDLAVTMFSLERNSDRSWLSVVFDNSTNYRFISGDKVPYYIQGGELWNDVYSPATRHVVTNKTSITFYGPQITADTYPSVSLFYNLGVSFGKALNSSDSTSYLELTAVYGIEAELMILDIAKLYWNWGFVTNPVFNEKPGAVSQIGFTFGV